ncbi:Transcription initiation factor TFIID subunit 6 [Rhodotorula toruloides]|nr:Transcription initiation factor TFIID subunit 6 [Rhodotorula toruloides]
MARQTSTVSGVWKKDSVKDVAESVGIANLPDEVAGALAGDVEYRLWEIIEESMKFMRHARRTRLKVEDVDQALKVRNLEPLWGFASSSQMPFKKTVTATGTVYHVEDEEVDLSKVIKTEIPSVPRDISFTAHWLAIEGVQPLIKENPTPQELARYAPKPASTALIPSASSAAGQPPSAVTPLVKHVLSRELQLYFTRLVDALGAGTQGATESSSEVREAALGSVRHDPGLHQLVPYLIAWGGEQASLPFIANNLHDLPALQRALDLFHAMLENPTLFVEPYLHQLTPPILTCLLTSALPPVPSDTYPSPPTIRTLAASLLHLLLERHAYAYPSLLPRVTKTLLRGLAGENRGLGARWGAARGLSGIVVGVGAEPATGGTGGGNKAVREWIGGGLKPLGEMIEREDETYEGERQDVVREIFNVLKESVLSLPSSADSSAPRPPLSDLTDRYGSLFASTIEAQWEQGGRDVHHAVAGIQQQLEQEDAEAEAEGEDEGDAEGDEDEEDEEDGGAMEE